MVWSFGVLRLHLIEYRLAPTSHDNLVAEFEELERESKAEAGGAAGDEDGATSKIHRTPLMTTVSAKGLHSWRAEKYLSLAIPSFGC